MSSVYAAPAITKKQQKLKDEETFDTSHKTRKILEKSRQLNQSQFKERIERIVNAELSSKIEAAEQAKDNVEPRSSVDELN